MDKHRSQKDRSPNTLNGFPPVLTMPKPIHESPVARSAADKLANKGVDAPALLGSLYMLRLLATGVRFEREQVARMIPGKSWGQLRRLPERIRCMAKEIKALNTVQYLDPRRWAEALGPSERAPQRKLLAESHVRLPVLLKTYADYLESQLAQLGAFRRKFSMEKQIILRLSKEIHKATGHYYDKDLATLLTVMLSKHFSAVGLKKLRERSGRGRSRR